MIISMCLFGNSAALRGLNGAF
jgi:hypothetical protein